MNAISGSLQMRLRRFNARFLCNASWAFATLKVYSVPLMDAIQEECLKKIRSFNAQDLANTFWAFATLQVDRQPDVLEVMMAHACNVRGMTPQGVANTLWAVAALALQREELMKSLGSQVVRAATKLKPQELSNAAWAFATLRVPDGEVLLAVSGAAMAKLPQLADVDLANVAWSFVTVTFEEDPIVAAMAQLSKERLQDGCIESESGVVNCLALVEAFQLAGKLEDSYLESALKSLVHHGHSMDGSEQLMPPPAELCISVARLETDVISEPLILSEASQPELYALWKPPNCSAASEEIRNPAARSEEPLALRNWLQEHFGHRAIVHDESVTYGMVHRLDRFTSGVLLWAPCYQGLYEARLQFAARRVQKEYLCLAQGVVKDVPLLIKAPIAEGSSELGATRSYISPIGRHAFTEVVDSATLADPDGQLFSLMQVRLHTGRTHQIRCHLAHEGHPLVGDPVYGGITPSWCQRHWLHAWKLSLQMTRGPVAVQVPVPHDLRRAVQRLRPAEVADAFRLRQWLG